MNNGYETLVPVSDRPVKSQAWRKLFNGLLRVGQPVAQATSLADRQADLWELHPERLYGPVTVCGAPGCGNRHCFACGVR